jgi:nucleoside-diphosphate-sugar epimerase
VGEENDFSGGGHVKILVTGASGFVGSRLIRAWAGGQDYQIRALVRPTSRLEDLDGLPFERCLGDVTDPASLRRAVQDVEAVVHMASLVGEAGRREDFFRVNRDGTRNLLEACRGLPIRRFVHISSLSVITGYREHEGTKEDAPYLSTGENYADSKIEAEKLVLDYHRKFGLPVTVLRPGFIYGPGDRLFLPAVIQNLRDGKVVLIDQGKKLLNLTYIGNLLEAIDLALRKDEATGEVFNITDGEEVTKKRFFWTIADRMDLARPARSIPFFMARCVCDLGTFFYRLFRIRRPPPLTRMKLRFAGQNQWFDVSKAESRLGYRHSFRFEEGIQKALQWHVSHFA